MCFTTPSSVLKSQRTVTGAFLRFERGACVPSVEPLYSRRRSTRFSAPSHTLT